MAPIKTAPVLGLTNEDSGSSLIFKASRVSSVFALSAASKSFLSLLFSPCEADRQRNK